MAYFTSLQNFIDTITSRLNKPKRGVDGSPGVSSTDMLEALKDTGKRMEDAIEFVTETNSSTYIQASIVQAQQQVSLATAQTNLASAQRVLTETARTEAHGYALQVQTLLAQGYTPKGNWSIATNTPDLSTITKAAGDAYIVLADGTSSLTGTSIAMKKGDAVHWNDVDEVWIWRPNATIPVDASVSPQKTNFLSPGKNLFNPADSGVQPGHYVLYSNGVATVSAPYNATGYMPVTAGQPYTLSYKHHIAWYDANRVYISGSNLNLAELNVTVTAPAGAAFLRCSVAVGSWAAFQVEAGPAFTGYQAFRWKLNTAAGVLIEVEKADRKSVV